MQHQPRRRAEVNGRFVQFFSRSTKIKTIRWYSRFKAEYRTKADAVKARQAWEEKGRILFPEDMKKATVKVEAKPAMRRSGTTYQQEMRL